MDLSRIAIEPRLRESWEAVDMGISMVRAWWWPLQLCWVVPSSIVFIISLFIFTDSTWLAFLITWWLNPLWDRFPLLLASRALFDEPLEVKAVWREWFRLLKTDWFSWLTWRRFSPYRSLDMPVTVLEQLRGEASSRRLTVLHRNSSGVAFVLTLLCMLFELLVLAAIWMFLILLIPSDFWVEEMMSGFNQFFWFSQWSVVVWFVALALVSPFYSVAGFALYINRRIELEGWDIEIRFRHLAQRFEASKPTKISVAKKITSVLLPLILCSSAMFAPQLARAQEPDSETQVVESAAASQAKDAIVTVLSGEDFTRSETREGWRFKETEEEQEAGSYNGFLEALAWFADVFGPFFKFVANIFKVVPILIWIGLGLMIAFAIYYFRDALASIASSSGQREKDIDVPDVMFGLDLRKESLPDNIPVEVIRLWQDGKHRDAIGLLYRATLSGLIYQFSFEFYDGYTEQECAIIVQQREQGQLSTYVHRLTNTWQHLAYAHRLPQDQQITDLCSEWPDHFEESVRRER